MMVVPALIIVIAPSDATVATAVLLEEYENDPEIELETVAADEKVESP